MNNRGKSGECAAGEYLKTAGYIIIEINYHCRFGEVDIIAKNDEFLVFAEVKTRKRGAMISGLESVNSHKIRRIMRTAELFLSQHEYELQPRIDVIEMLDENGCLTVVNHIENAL